MSELAGRTALVTGATAGIGRAVAKLLAQHGAEVVAHGRDPQRGAALVDAIRADGGTARFVAADLGDTQDVERLAREAGAVDPSSTTQSSTSSRRRSKPPRRASTGSSRSTHVRRSSWWQPSCRT